MDTHDDARPEPDVLPFASAKRPISWTATLLALVALGMGGATTLFAYAFLGLEGGGWLNTGVEPPPLMLPGAAAIALLASLLPGVGLQRAAKAASPAGIQASAGGLLVLGAAFLVLQGMSYAELGLQPSQDAYASVFALAVALHHSIMLGGMGAGAMIAFQLWDAPGLRAAGAATSLSLYWWFVVGSWALTGSVLYLSPFVW